MARPSHSRTSTVLSKEEKARFMSFVSINPESGCWEWHGMSTWSGYGYFWLDGERRRAHRVSYMAFKGNPKEKNVLHKCDNPPCVNPEHLWLGDQRDNGIDMVKKGRCFHSAQTHCKRGHEFTEGNTRNYDGRRYCKTCTTLYNKALWQRAKVERAHNKTETN